MKVYTYMRQVDGKKDVCFTLGGPLLASEIEQPLSGREIEQTMGVSRGHIRYTSVLKGRRLNKRKQFAELDITINTQ